MPNAGLPIVEVEEREFLTSFQPAWLIRMDPRSCLGHLLHGCQAMADSLLVFVPDAQKHGALNLREADIR